MLTRLFNAVSVGLLLAYGLSASGQTRATTDAGVVEGKLSGDGHVTAYLGIPYAAPPVGPLRWRPPQRHAKWKGVLPVKEFGPHCMQPHVFQDMIYRDAGQSEDCLTLNIWTPAKKSTAPLPVMVWIYGGGFNAGATSEPRQDGEHLAHKGVVLVSMNYRLGIFGFMANHELAAESAKHAAGNYGLMDQAEALHWVQRNITSFGGDPANVTLFGESAGAFAVSAHIASRWSKGTFVRAIGESGGAFAVTGLTFPALATSEQKYEAFTAAAWGPKSSLKDLRRLSADELLTATATRKDTPLFQPDIDGDFLPSSVREIYADGPPSRVPMIAGWNHDEGHAPLEGQTAAALQRIAQEQFGARSDDFLRLYAAGTKDQAARSADDFASDVFMGYSAWQWLEAASKLGLPVYRYSFDLPSPRDAFHPGGTAFHSDEIEYVFGNLDSRKDATWRPEDYRLSDQMQAYWTNFAKTGNPNQEGLPAWPVYGADGGWMVMHLDATPHAEPDHHRERYLFLKEVWGSDVQASPTR